MSTKEKIKSKALYCFCLLGMCSILIGLAYFFFLRTINVDVMDGLKLSYTGESGLAKVSARNDFKDLNQRLSEFMDTVTYTVEPNEDLSNGDEITITAKYSHALAQTYHYKPVNTKTTVKVEGLNIRYESKDDIPEKYLDEIDKQMEDYLQKHRVAIFETEYPEEPHTSITLTETPVYSCFLKSKSKNNTDKVLTIYLLEFRYEGKQKNLYYLMSASPINDSNSTEDEDIYGEKAYLSNNEMDKESFNHYIDRIYSPKYTIETIMEFTVPDTVKDEAETADFDEIDQTEKTQEENAEKNL